MSCAALLSSKECFCLDHRIVDYDETQTGGDRLGRASPSLLHRQQVAPRVGLPCSNGPSSEISVRNNLGVVTCRRVSSASSSGTDSTGRISVRKMIAKGDKCAQLWRDFFSDPSQWWDNRSEKPNSKFPDFKHKQTGEGLWLVDGRNPPWVGAELALVAPGLSIFARSKKLSEYNKAGQYDRTMEVFVQMQREGINGDRYEIVYFLNACAALQLLHEGRSIHRQVVETGLESNLHVSSSLVDMFVKCGCLEDAWNVFEKMPTRDVIAWNVMILGCAKCGQGMKALQLFQQMQLEGVRPNSGTFVGLLNACASSTAVLEEGRRVHEQIIQSGCGSDVHVVCSLIDMYAKCGSIDDAWRVFQNMDARNVVAWNCMIAGFVNCGFGTEALELFHTMHREGFEPDSVTFVGVLNACASTGALGEGRGVHEQIIRSGFKSNIHLRNCLIVMYAKCGSMDDAWRVFDMLPTRHAVAWSAMIQGYVKSGEDLKALELFRQMQREGVQPDAVTYASLLNACAGMACLEEGRVIHEQIIRSDLESNLHVSTSLIDMYAKCGSIDDAWRVFEKMLTRDVVAWNVMVLGCAKGGQEMKALELFRQMQAEGVEPNSGTFVGLLNACASISALKEGKGVHEEIIRKGWGSDIYVCTSLVDMYVKCGSMEDAWRVFDSMDRRKVYAWNVMILGCVKCGDWWRALDLCEQMQREGVEPNSVTFVGILNVCARSGALQEGKRVHEQIMKSGLESDVTVATSLIDMYAKCGSIEDARTVFNNSPSCDVVGWNTMIMGYAKHGLAKDAVAIFEEMLRAGIQVDEVTFIGLLSACSHGGLVQEAIHYFESMSPVYGVPPLQDHYTCMVDILCRAGRLHDAEEMLESMPIKSDAVAWTSLLGACKIHGNVEIEQRASKRVDELDSTNTLL